MLVMVSNQTPHEQMATIKRYSRPTSLDHAPKGTKCLVARPFEYNYDIYLQISIEEDDPKWEYIGIGQENIV
jgi:hypothetical protein